MLKGLRTFNTTNSDTDRLYQNVSQFANQFTTRPFLDGLLLKDLTLTAGSNNPVNHKLGRKLQGWVIVNKTAETDVWAPTSLQTRPDKTLVLSCTANVTISLYLF